MFLIVFYLGLSWSTFGLCRSKDDYYGNFDPVLFPCMPKQRTCNPQACIDYMRQAMADPNLFWFGTEFRQICENAEPNNPNCREWWPQGAQKFSFQTLGSHMFQDNGYNYRSRYLDNLQYPLTVAYTAPAGKISILSSHIRSPVLSAVFRGCNTTVSYNQTLWFDVNPNMAAIGVLFFRETPQLYAPSCTLNNLCTVMFFDLGNGNLHNLWVNWPKEVRPFGLLRHYVVPRNLTAKARVSSKIVPKSVINGKTARL